MARFVRDATATAAGETFVFPDVIRGLSDPDEVASEVRRSTDDARALILEVKRGACANGNGQYANLLDQVSTILGNIERRFT